MKNIMLKTYLYECKENRVESTFCIFRPVYIEILLDTIYNVIYSIMHKEVLM